MKAISWQRSLALWLLLVASAAPVQAQTETPASPALTPAVSSAAPLTIPLPGDEPAGAETDDSFSGLFRQIGDDFRALPQRDHFVWLGVGAALTFASHPADRTLTHTLSTNGDVEEALEPGSLIGSTMVQLGAPLLTYAVGRLIHQPEVAHIGGDLFRSQVLAQAVTHGIKFAAQRTRPDGTSFSFPSGHTASAFASATVLERHFGWKVGLPAYGVATYVAASRLSENRHFLSDVIFGAAIGIVAGHSVTIGHGHTRFAVTPMAVPGGAGVAFVRITQ